MGDDKPKCYKRRYSKKGAEMALLETRIAKELKHNNKRKEQRTYYHKPCKAWHITSMPIAERKDNGNQDTSQSTMQAQSNGQSSMD